MRVAVVSAMRPLQAHRYLPGISSHPRLVGFMTGIKFALWTCKPAFAFDAEITEFMLITILKGRCSSAKCNKV